MSTFVPTSSSPNGWTLYPTDPTQGSQIQDKWKGFGAGGGGGGASINAISFGFVATAILVSLFLIMAIFEHLYRPHDPASSLEAGLVKLQNPPPVPMTTYGSDFSVVMPGQEYPTYIAQPAPLLPCQRESICFPPNYHS